MRASVLLFAAASVAIASAETVEIWGAGDTGDGEKFVAYRVGSDATATTYILGCPSAATVNEKNCVFNHPLQYTIGASKVEMTTAITENLTLKQECALAGTTQAICTANYEGSGTSDFGSSEDQTQTTITMTGKEAEALWGPATVVADINSIYNGNEASLAPASTSTGASIPPATTGAAATSAPTSTPTGTTGTESGAVETSQSVAASQSTGGMPQITGSCGWAVGGVAAAVALAAF
ncbi:hypothetical protein V502_08941 [Pseudogymnoascus sp. VKM F-4520 (FW-2644)]|nr:hypothetical protein V502_08941 [Pseudogymnoascus sp. VKM F-4520 (FW-2644)]